MPPADAGVATSATRATVSSAAVLDAALTLFAERGYHGTAVSQIADALGIRTPSLYNHMRSKQELLEQIVGRTLDAVLADFRAAIRDAESPADQLRAATRSYALRHATHRRDALVVNRDLNSLPEPGLSTMRERRREHERAIRAIITAGIDRGLFSVATPALASFAILEMSVSIARWFRENGALNAGQVADQYAEFAMRIVRYRP